MSVPPWMKKQRIDAKLYQELLDARKFDQLINYLDSIKDDDENNWNYHHHSGCNPGKTGRFLPFAGFSCSSGNLPSH